MLSLWLLPWAAAMGIICTLVIELALVVELGAMLPFSRLFESREESPPCLVNTKLFFRMTSGLLLATDGIRLGP